MKDKHTADMYLSHRKRLRLQVNERGAESLDNYKLIEMFLFDLLPRIDTYPAAHRLLDRFGSVGGIFSASRDELLSVYGIGPKSADRIIMTGEIINRTVLERLTSAPLDSEERIAPVISWLMRNSATDDMLFVFLDPSNNFSCYRLFGKGLDNAATEEAISGAADAGARYAAVAHRHPARRAAATPEDIDAAKRIADVISAVGITVIANYIVNDEGVFPVK